MMRALSPFILFIALLSLAAGCSYESRGTTLHKPGVYKGAKDTMLTQQQNQLLIDRFKLVQTDR
jgi:hypothetical protein